MSERRISLNELLNLSIEPPHMRSVNLAPLHALLLAVLKELGIQEQTTEWKDSFPRCRVEEFTALTQEEEEKKEEEDSYIQLHGREGRGEHPSRIQNLEDGVSEAMGFLQELKKQKEDLRTQVETLHQQVNSPASQAVGGEPEEVKKCCLRVEALEEDVKSLRDAIQSLPDQEQMSRVTRDATQSVLLSDTGNLQQSGTSADCTDMAEALRTISHQQKKVSELEVRVAALEEDQTQLAELREFMADQGNQDQLMEELRQQRALIESLMSEHEKLENLEEVLLKPESGSASEDLSDRADADSKGLRELKLQVSYLRKCVHQLEEDLKHLRERQDLCEETAADQNLQDQLDDLQGMLEDFILSLSSHLSSSRQDEIGQDQNQRPESSQSLQSTKRSTFTAKTIHVCRKLNLLFQRYEHLQDSVKILMGEGGALPRDRDPDGVGAEDSQKLNDVHRSILHLQADCEKLQEATTLLRDDSMRKHERLEELYKMTEELSVRKADKQMVEDEIEADKTALENKVSRLQFDTTMEQLNAMFHDLLNKVTDQEQDWHSVMDKLSSEMERKLNRIEMDSMKKQLEDRWRNIYKTLQAQEAPEADDAAALRKQLVERFHCLSCDRPILKRISSSVTVTLPSFPPFPSRRSRRAHPAEASRQQYRSHMPEPGQNCFRLASLRWRRAELQRNYAAVRRQIQSLERQRQLNQVRQNRTRSGESAPVRDSRPTVLPYCQACDITVDRPLSERIPELVEYGRMLMSRNCGGSHTSTSTLPRRSCLQHTKLHSLAEADGAGQVDIIGEDGRLYRGRLDLPEMRSPDSKLPTITPKDGAHRTKDKAKSSPSPRLVPSPEGGQTSPGHHSAHKSPQCSRSASSCSGRDWPVSALGCCTSQSSITQASADESSLDPRGSAPLNL